LQDHDRGVRRRRISRSDSDRARMLNWIISEAKGGRRQQKTLDVEVVVVARGARESGRKWISRDVRKMLLSWCNSCRSKRRVNKLGQMRCWNKIRFQTVDVDDSFSVINFKFNIAIAF
jgi:hypothetical protein